MDGLCIGLLRIMREITVLVVVDESDDLSRSCCDGSGRSILCMGSSLDLESMVVGCSIEV